MGLHKYHKTASHPLLRATLSPAHQDGGETLHARG